jgi:hypothetical protein
MYKVEKTESSFTLTCPGEAFDGGRMAALLGPWPGISFSSDQGAQGECAFQIQGPQEILPSALNHLFTALNGYPERRRETLAEFTASSAPLASCIVLTGFNDLFVRNVLLPSIIENSRGVAIEIILVYVGFGADLGPFQHLTIIESEMGCIAKGYNAGVRKARGKYVALFHDDCYLDDPEWLSKSITALKGDVVSIVPEVDSWYGVPVGKATPMVMRRDDFLRLGGYDEYYYVGVEDMDLSCAIHAAGLRQERIDLGYRHLRGMGSSLVAHEHPYQLKYLFGYQVLPPAGIRTIHLQAMRRLLENDVIRLLEADYHLHFIDKFETWLDGRTTVALSSLIEMYKLKRHPFLLTPDIACISNREKLLETYRREIMNVEELSRTVK